MSETIKKAPGTLFWVVGIIFLLWSLMGCAGYLAEHLMPHAKYIESFGAEKAALRGETPVWATAAYAVGVWGGLAGAILLLLGKKLCLPFFYASFIGALLGFSVSIFDGRFRAVMGGGDWAMMLLVWAVCIFIIWWARKHKAKGVLR